MKRIQAYSKSLVFTAACIGAAFFGIAYLIMGSLLPQLSKDLAFDSIQSASLVSFLPLGVLVGSTIFGPIIDRTGYKLIMVVSAFCLMLGLIGVSLVGEYSVLSTCIFLIGFGGGILNGVTQALVASISDDQERGANLSLLGLCFGVGALVMPLLISGLSSLYTSNEILQFAGTIVFLAMLFFACIRFPMPVQTVPVSFSSLVGLLKHPVLWVISCFLFLQSGLEALYNNWSTTYMLSTGLASYQQVLYGLSYFVSGMIITRLICSYLLPRIPNRLVVIACILINILAVGCFVMSTNLWMLNLAMFLAGVGMAGGFPIMIARIGNLFPELTGSAIGFSLFMALVGNTITNYIVGLGFDVYGEGFFSVALLTIFALQLLLLLGGRKVLKSF